MCGSWSVTVNLGRTVDVVFIRMLYAARSEHSGQLPGIEFVLFCLVYFQLLKNDQLLNSVPDCFDLEMYVAK